MWKLSLQVDAINCNLVGLFDKSGVDFGFEDLVVLAGVPVIFDGIRPSNFLLGNLFKYLLEALEINGVALIKVWAFSRFVQDIEQESFTFCLRCVGDDCIAKFGGIQLEEKARVIELSEFICPACFNPLNQEILAQMPIFSQAGVAQAGLDLVARAGRRKTRQCAGWQIESSLVLLERLHFEFLLRCA